MGSSARRGRPKDRDRDIPGQNTRRNRLAREATNAARREKYRAARLGEWGGCRRARSSRHLRASVLEQVRTFEKSADGDPIYAANLLSGFVSHHKMEKVRRMSHVKSKKEQEATDLLVNNLRVALKDVKNTHSQNQVSAKRTALDMTVSMEVMDRHLGTTAARLLGLNRRLMGPAALRREQILQVPASHRTWATKGRATRKDKLPPELIQYIKDFWHNNSRPSPKAKDVIKHTQKHYLSVTQTEMFTTFREHFNSENKFPLTRCPGQRLFERMKPFYIYKETDRSVCCCKNHVEIDLLKRGFNNLRKISHNRSCCCDCVVCQAPSQESLEEQVPIYRGVNTPGQNFSEAVSTSGMTPTTNTISAPCSSHERPTCKAHEQMYDSVRTMCGASLCPKEMHEPLNLELHKFACIEGSCEHCGFSRKFPFCQSQEEGHNPDQLAWSRYEQISTGVDTEGKEHFKPAVVQKTTSKNEFMEYLKDKIPEFVKHDFIYRWEDRQFKKAMEIFPVGSILSVIDYAENYTMQPQDEIQSEHWTSTQVTILVHIVYYHEEDSTYSERKIGKVCHYYVSDDRKHDSAFVQHAFARLDDWLREEGVEYTQHWVWSDGAPTQFKNSTAFAFIGRYPLINPGKRMIWSFFGPGHGKGEHDGMGAIVKRWLRQYQLDRDGVFLENAEAVVNLLRLNLSLGCFSTFRKRQEHQKTIHRVFHYVPEGVVIRDANLSCATVIGTRNSIFQVMGSSPTDHTLLQTRPLACFCPTCVYGDFSRCQNAAYTGGDWAVVNLVPTGPLPDDLCPHIVEQNSTDDIGGSNVEPDYLSRMLSVGSYFAVRCSEDNVDGDPYWILQCTKERETLESERTHTWDATTFSRGEVVVTGTYMTRADNSLLKYKRARKRAPATIYSHLVVSINLPLELESEEERHIHDRAKQVTPGNSVFNLPGDYHEAIMEQLEEPSDLLDIIDLSS